MSLIKKNVLIGVAIAATTLVVAASAAFTGANIVSYNHAKNGTVPASKSGQIVYKFGVIGKSLGEKARLNSK